MMSKKSLGLVFLVMVFSFASFSSALLNISLSDKGGSIISGLSNPALFDLTFFNNGSVNDEIMFITQSGMTLQPASELSLVAGEQTVVSLKAYVTPSVRDEKRGLYYFTYVIRSKNEGDKNYELPITILDLRDTLSFKVADVRLGDKEASVSVKNLYGAYIDNVKLHLVSSIFDVEKVISLKPLEEVSFNVPINKDISSLVAGAYILSSEVTADKVVARYSNEFSYIKQDNLEVKERTEGIVVKSTFVEKTNKGNVPVVARITISKDVFSRLFTIYSIEPSTTVREGLMVNYVWEREIKPSESFSVRVNTNYTFPFFFLLLVIIVSSLVYIYTRTSVIVEKRVSFVKTRGGEFALKVRLHVKARKFVEDMQVIDMLPGMTTLYDKFGVKPDKIDSVTRRLIWNVDKLNAGEERVFSYIIYSKVRVVGKFELPSATVLFEREGKTHEVISNRTFFVSDISRSE